LNFIWIIWIIWIDVCIHHFLLFFGFSIHEWNPAFITCYSMMWYRNSSPSLWYLWKKEQSWTHSLLFVCTCENFWKPSHAKFVIV
jgi:hypothetical protein